MIWATKNPGLPQLPRPARGTLDAAQLECFQRSPVGGETESKALSMEGSLRDQCASITK